MARRATGAAAAAPADLTAKRPANGRTELTSVPAGPTWEQMATTHSVQAAAEGVADDGSRIEFMGQRFRLAGNIGLMPLLAFANASKNGLDSDDMEGMAAMYALIRDTVDQTRVQKTGADGGPVTDPSGDPVWEGPSDWQRFERHAIDKKADGDDLMGFIQRAMEVISARPTKRREGSSATSPPTSAKSRASSSSRDMSAWDGLTPVAEIGQGR